MKPKTIMVTEDVKAHVYSDGAIVLKQGADMVSILPHEVNRFVESMIDLLGSPEEGDE